MILKMTTITGLPSKMRVMTTPMKMALLTCKNLILGGIASLCFSVRVKTAY